MGIKTWKVRAYTEYDLEASTEEESIKRLTECVMKDLEECKDIRDIAEVHSEKVSDKGMDGDDDDAADAWRGEGEDEKLIEKGIRRVVRKSGEHSVTPQIIERVHESLSDEKTGRELLDFLRSAEPVFVDEVNRFIQTEIERMRSSLNEDQALYIGSIIGATYVSGFLMAREAMYKVYGGLMDIASPNEKRIAKIHHLVSLERAAGKSAPEMMGELFADYFKGKKRMPAQEKKTMKKKAGKKKKGK